MAWSRDQCRLGSGGRAELRRSWTLLALSALVAVAILVVTGSSAAASTAGVRIRNPHAHVAKAFPKALQQLLRTGSGKDFKGAFSSAYSMCRGHNDSWDGAVRLLVIVKTAKKRFGRGIVGKIVNGSQFNRCTHGFRLGFVSNVKHDEEGGSFGTFHAKSYLSAVIKLSYTLDDPSPGGAFKGTGDLKYDSYSESGTTAPVLGSTCTSQGAGAKGDPGGFDVFGGQLNLDPDSRHVGTVQWLKYDPGRPKEYDSATCTPDQEGYTPPGHGPQESVYSWRHWWAGNPNHVGECEGCTDIEEGPWFPRHWRSARGLWTFERAYNDTGYAAGTTSDKTLLAMWHEPSS